MSEENETIDETTALQADLETSRKEVESLSAQLVARDSKMGELQTTITEKGVLIEAQETELATLREASVIAEGTNAELTESLSEAIGKYRTSLVASNPEVPDELIQGDTVIALEGSLEIGKGLVDKVKGNIAASVEAAEAQTVVPAGAPERTGPDLSSMTPKEKIAYAIGKETE